MKTMLTGHKAIGYVTEHGGDLGKFADPTEDARYPLDVDEAREIAREDPSLIYYCDDDMLNALGAEAGAAGDLDQVRLCDLAVAGMRGHAAARAECANAIRAAQAQEG